MKDNMDDTKDHAKDDIEAHNRISCFHFFLLSSLEVTRSFQKEYIS
jgi:hypothetical protein